MIVISCVHRKTVSQGMAQLAVTTDIEEVLLFYQCTESCGRGYQLATWTHQSPANTECYFPVMPADTWQKMTGVM